MARPCPWLSGRGIIPRLRGKRLGKSRQQVAGNLAQVRERIAQAAARRGVEPGAVRLVAVTKGVPAERIEEAIAAGVQDCGENYLQEALPKIARLGRRARWHFIGHLQTNKVKAALPHFDLIQAVDSEHLAQEIARRAAALGRQVPVLLEVNTSGEAGKFGVAPEQVGHLLARCVGLGLPVQGLMTIGRLGAEEAGTRQCFRALAQLFAQYREAVPGGLQWLSMGMSGDFELAIEEGANMIRVGTAIFGPRPLG